MIIFKISSGSNVWLCFNKSIKMLLLIKFYASSKTDDRFDNFIWLFLWIYCLSFATVDEEKKWVVLAPVVCHTCLCSKMAFAKPASICHASTELLKRNRISVYESNDIERTNWYFFWINRYLFQLVLVTKPFIIATEYFAKLHTSVDCKLKQKLIKHFI